MTKTTDTHREAILEHMRAAYGAIQTKHDADGLLVKLPSGRVRLILRRDIHARRQRQAIKGLGVPRVVDMGPLTWDNPASARATTTAAATGAQS